MDIWRQEILNTYKQNINIEGLRSKRCDTCDKYRTDFFTKTTCRKCYVKARQ